MKKIISILSLVFILHTMTLSQSSGDYRSAVTGNWSAAGTWETYDGSAWGAAVSIPGGTSGTITIQSGHTVTVDAALTINGSAVVVEGYLKNSTGITRTSGTFTFNNGSTYEHALNSGTIPTSTWNTGSTCLITGVTGGAPSGANQNFYNFTWNCPGQTTGLNTGWDNITIGGNVTCTASGASAAQQFRMTSAATTRNILIMGNIIVNGGFITATGSGGAAQYNVNVIGNIDVQSGKLGLSNGSGGIATWKVCGNISIASGAQFVVPSNTTSGTRLVFAKKNGTQTYSNAGTNSNLSYGVDSNATVQLNSPLTVGNSTTGFLVLTSGTFVTTSTNILTLNSGASVSGGSSTAYINGPMTLTVAATSSTKTFPIGKGTSYRPITLVLNHDAATSTTYKAEVFNALVSSRTVPSGLDSVSSVRYYTVTKGSGANLSGSLGGTIQMSYDADDNVPDASLLRTAKDDGAGSWSNLGGSGTANTTGTITSNTFFTLNSTNDFILATATPAVVAVVPTVSTTTITDISTATASGGGNVTNDGGASVTARGICWNMGGTPTISDNTTSNGTGNGSFTSSLTSLSAGVTYYVRAYATNSAGTGYGSEVSFTTLAALAAPTVTTTSISNIVNTTAAGGGNVTEWGGTNVTARGICWNTAGTPTLENAIDYTSNGTGTGSFTSSLGGLSLGTTYYVRAYATNSVGTSYGSEVSFSTPAAQPDVVKVVAQDGSKDYTTVQAAFDAVTSNYTGKWYIYVKNGTYYEKLLLAAGKINVVLVGESRDNTILTYDDYSGKNVNSSGTSTSYSVAIDADDFEAQNITFRNTATAAQAVALRVNGDRQEYYNCKMLGYQDTYYTWGGSRAHRIYNKDCYIQGSVDFIFGRDIALFENCTLNVIRNTGTITAANTDAGYSYGYVFKNCTITNDATGYDGNPVTTFYLGRPWQSNPRVAFLNCSEPAALNSLGWSSSSAGSATTADCFFSEYNCTGDGSATGGRAAFSSQLSAGAAANYTTVNIFAKNTSSNPYGANWVPSQEAIDYTPLPVELVTFTAAVNGRSVILNWSTATEVNNAGFEIQKSEAKSQKSEKNWTKVGFVEGAGRSNAVHHYSYSDNAAAGTTVAYRLKQIDRDGKFTYSNTVEAVTALSANDYLLSQNYPNPFNPSTTFSFAVKNAERTTVKVYNLIGQEVAILFNDVAQQNQLYTLRFDAKDLPSGIYLYSLRSASRNEVKKMLLMK